jgi:hypothetical protein
MAVVPGAGEPLSPQAADLVRRIARMVLDEPAGLMAEVYAAVSAAADEPLRSEPVLAAEVDASTRANVLDWAASTLDATVSHISDPADAADAARLADSARDRLLYCCAIPLYRHAADAGDSHAAGRLAGLLAERGDLDELRARADTGDEYAAGQLAGVLVKLGGGEEAERLRRLGLNQDGSIACA